MDFSTNGTKILYLHQSDTTTILKRNNPYQAFSLIIFSFFFLVLKIISTKNGF